MRMLTLLLLLPAMAFAQAPAPRIDACTGAVIPAGVSGLADFDFTKAYPECLDMRPGSFGVNLAGYVEWDYCKDPATGRYGPRLSVVTRADMGDVEFVREAIRRGGTRMSAQERFQLAKDFPHRVKPLGHPENAAAWCPFRQQIADGTPRPPAATGWVTARNASYPTRPTYAVINGKRSTVSNGRIPINVPCEMTGAIVEGPTTYGYPDGAPPKSVAVCVRR